MSKNIYTANLNKSALPGEAGVWDFQILQQNRKCLIKSVSIDKQYEFATIREMIPIERNLAVRDRLIMGIASVTPISSQLNITAAPAGSIDLNGVNLILYNHGQKFYENLIFWNFLNCRMEYWNMDSIYEIVVRYQVTFEIIEIE